MDIQNDELLEEIDKELSQPVKASKKRRTSPLLWMVLLVIILGISAFFILRQTLGIELSFFTTPTTTPSQTIEPTSTPSPTLLLAQPTKTEGFTPEPTEVQPSATATTAKITNTVTAFPTATYTATIEGEVIIPTPSATYRWYLRRNTATLRPTRTPTFTRTPTITPTPTPREPELRIDSPGPLSKVVSPLYINMRIAPGADGTVLIELTGEDGRLINSYSLYGGVGRHYQMQHYLEFDIPGAGEFGRLTLSVRDVYGRITSLSSVDIVLLKLGSDENNPAVNLLDPYIFWNPKKNETVSGGVLWIDGLAYSVNESPVIVELLTKSGDVIATRQILLPEVKEGFTHARFDVGLPYAVDGLTSALLVMRQESDNRLEGTVFLSSVPILLEP